MRYMLMLYADEKAGAQIPPDQMQKAMETLSAYQQALTKAGAFVMTAPLARTADAKTLRMEGGEASYREDGKGGAAFVNDAGELKVHDGPYAETREQFGGFYIIEAADMDEALAWAKKCPAAQWGPVEVRALIPGF
ncbi:YciI family protein [Devosia sp. A16]|uniref:YciI family protein n=1 Tax=Devosia sp. A16 TaxID=1736675 RepID=UPI0006D80F81|nr:YciI family protein [Devosia sp. A16]